MGGCSFPSLVFYKLAFIPDHTNSEYGEGICNPFLKNNMEKGSAHPMSIVIPFFSTIQDVSLPNRNNTHLIVRGDALGFKKGIKNPFSI